MNIFVRNAGIRISSLKKYLMLNLHGLFVGYSKIPWFTHGHRHEIGVCLSRSTVHFCCIYNIRRRFNSRIFNYFSGGKIALSNMGHATGLFVEFIG